ncbi:MAG: Uma2 family endonuclease [Isosphaeraceae bacterium]
MATVTATQPISSLPLPSPANVYRITVDQYDRMVESGVLAEDDPVQLLGGILVRQMPKYPRHVFPTEETRNRLEPIVPAGWYVRQEGPVRIPAFDEPEPDVAVARGNSRTYRKHHPGPKDIALVVEVAATKGSLNQARVEKMSAYARAGIPVYWIINLTRTGGIPRAGSGRVEVYTRPTRTRGYRDHLEYKSREQVPVVIDGREVGRIAVADLFP